MTDEPQNQTAPEMIEKEKYLRLAAEFENYRKSIARRIEDDKWAAKRDAYIMMLDLIDGGEVVFKNSPVEVREKYGDWYRGMLQAHQQGISELKKIGVERIETIGKEFDPRFMEAIKTVGGGLANTVKDEWQSGYSIDGKVIRPARVIIYE